MAGKASFETGVRLAGASLAFGGALRHVRAVAVDHEQRRRAIAAIAIDLISREGLEAVTFRRIAAEAGSSTRAVTFYFTDKHEFLLYVFDELARLGELLFAEARDRDPDDPVAALLTMVPWCAANVRRWKAYLAFWDQAVRDPDFAAAVARSTAAGVTGIGELLSGHATRIDVAVASQLLNAVIQGLAMQAIVDPDTYHGDVLRHRLETALDAVLGQAEVSDEVLFE